MILLGQLILLTSIWVLGLTIATQEKMILEKVAIWAEAQNKAILKAVILCAWCMPSIHSVVGYGFAMALGVISEWSWTLLVLYPLVVMGASITSGLIWTICKLIEKKLEVADHTEQLLHFDIKDRKEKKYFQNLSKNGNEKIKLQVRG